MRIGLVAPPWIAVPPPEYGGTEAVIGYLARGLSELGHDVTLFTVGDSTSPVRRRYLFRVGVTPMGQTVPEAAHVLAAHRALWDVDVLHDHTVLGPLLASRGETCGPPVVTTNHGPFTDVTRPVFRAIARHVAVVAISQDQARRARDVPVAAVIHHGIDLETYRPGTGSGGYLVFVGRMSPDKGVAAAVRIAHQAGRSLRIVCKMREAEEYDYYRREVRPLLSRQDDDIAELGLEERVRVVGEASGLLNPIVWPEPFGLVMAEALATGTPVIARSAGAAPEIVTPGRTGFLFRTDREAVACLDRLPEIDRAACRADAEARFSLLRMAADYVRLYEGVLGATQHRSPWRPGSEAKAVG